MRVRPGRCRSLPLAWAPPRRHIRSFRRRGRGGVRARSRRAGRAAARCRRCPPHHCARPAWRRGRGHGEPSKRRLTRREHRGFLPGSARTVPGVDDAGGGRRGSRAVESAELWQVLSAGWAVPRQRGRDLGGSLNLNLLVRRGDNRLVVRVHRPSVSQAACRTSRPSGTGLTPGYRARRWRRPATAPGGRGPGTGWSRWSGSSRTMRR